jgi:hypothetical protein
MSQKIDIAAEVIRQTPSAVLVKNLEEDDVWLPKSQTYYEPGWEEVSDGDMVTFFVAEWLAKREGLI